MPGSRPVRVGMAVLAAALATAIGVPAPSSASVGGGNISIGWSIPGVPAGGLSNITFPITVDPRTLHKDGTYFAQQFGFTNSGGAYTGLQPRADLNGHERLHAAFSSFIAGTTSTDPLCHTGADGGPGVSCAVEFDGVYGHTYDLTVARTGADTWSGTATDTVTGTATHIGTWSLTPGSGNLTGYYGGFVEYYLGIPSCSQMPYINVTFGPPRSTDGGGLRGTSKANNEYGGECLGHAGYASASTGGGTQVSRGFVANTPSGSPVPATPASPPSAGAASSSPRATASASTKAGATPSRSSAASATPSAGAPSADAAGEQSGPVPTPGPATPPATDPAMAAASSTGSQSTMTLAAVLGAIVVAIGALVFHRRRRASSGAHQSRQR